LTIGLSIGLWLGTSVSGERPWVLVDTRSETLSVMEGEVVIRRFDNISIGRGGAAEHRVRGSDQTPIGTYRIAWVETDSPYRLFLGLSYPGLPDARWALKEGLISEGTYRAIARALREGRPPPHDTPLGGRLGIHGLGRANPGIHASLHWTHGCIALTNHQIDVLAGLVGPGTRVVIR
jgi:murein L,D-transpeptidase YafK